MSDFWVTHSEKLSEELDALRAENERLRALLKRIYDWDHLTTAADGAYWSDEIDAVLGRSKGP